MFRRWLAACALSLAGLALPLAMAEEPAGNGCLECHEGDDNSKGKLASPLQLANSVHRSLGCTDCHQSISSELKGEAGAPHGDRVEAVKCGECHEEEAEAYKKHGRLDVDKDPDLPGCASCHGTHDILSSSDRASRVHPINLPGTCLRCHTDVDLVKKHFILRDAPLRNYQGSVHGRASQKGLHVAATCSDCHSSSDGEGHRSAHRILSAAEPTSTIFRFNIPETCGKCHQYITKDYWDGIHGQYVKHGSSDAPVCTDCHGEHGIVSPRDRLSPVSASRVAEETCARCHESALLNEKYGLAGGRLASYVDSYHGLKSKAGDVTVANCASCHGSHRILPSTDRQSSIHADNLTATCGECHPGISTQLAQTKIHATSTGLRAGWPEFFRKLYMVIIAVTIGFMLLHNGADWLRSVRKMMKAPSVRRLSPGETAQHWVLMLSFSVLVITGFSLRFSEAVWVKWLFGWEGGFEARGIIHRVSAVVMTVGAVWHGFYMFTSRGWHWLKDMMPGRKDVADFGRNMAYLAGLRSEELRFGRFSYMEKIEYWALMWGTIIMTVSGAMLWFDNYFVDRLGLPKGVLDVMLVIHYYEAWLAFLAILIWHVYGTVFKAGVYPMNPAWLAGRMPKDMYTHEHPDGPKLRARTLRPHYEDEEDADGSPDAAPSLHIGAGQGGAGADGRSESPAPAVGSGVVPEHAAQGSAPLSRDA